MENNLDGKEFDLSNEEQRKELQELVEFEDNFFKPEENVTYKVNLTSSKVNIITKKFDNDLVTKYVLNIKAVDADGNTFEGIWEAGVFVARSIFKNYEEKATFKITRSGSGLKTKYNVVKDF